MNNSKNVTALISELGAIVGEVLAPVRFRRKAFAVASAFVVALGLPIADPLIGLGITAVILKITWDSWWTVQGRRHSH